MKIMNQSFLVTLMLLITTHVSAQSNALPYTGAPERLAYSNNQFFMSPAYSPDGNYIAFTTSNYKGIWIKNLNNNQVKQLTTDDAAGYGFQWSPDSKAILSRAARFEGLKRFNAVKIFMVETGEEKQISDYSTFMPGLPRWTSGGEEVYLYDGRNLNVMRSGISSASLNKNNSAELIVYARQSKIFTGRSSGSLISFEPFSGKEYLNITASPDGMKIAFEVYGGNLYIINSDGTGLIDLGKGFRPQWSPDSRRIVYMITEDDGHSYVSSELYTVKSDGTEKIKLTNTENILEMDPSWAPDGKAVIFHEMNEGAIYKLPVQLN